MRYKVTIAYDGSAFHGWQEQTGAEQAHLRTVQKVVRQAVQEVARQPIILRGASRTDTGVHAAGQVADFTAEGLTIPIERMALAINSRLPADVEVRRVEPAGASFDAIGGAIDKQYRYRIWNAARRPLGQRKQVYHCWVPLDPVRMNDAAQRLVGEHDFAAFTNAGHGRTSTVRTVHACHVESHPLTGMFEPPPRTVDAAGANAGHEDGSNGVPARIAASEGRELHVVIRGNGFLYNMVRIIAGTLIEVGRGHWEPQRIDDLLASGDRQASGPTLEPQGLCLEWIRYGE